MKRYEVSYRTLTLLNEFYQFWLFDEYNDIGSKYEKAYNYIEKNCHRFGWSNYHNIFIRFVVKYLCFRPAELTNSYKDYQKALNYLDKHFTKDEITKFYDKIMTEGDRPNWREINLEFDRIKAFEEGIIPGYVHAIGVIVRSFKDRLKGRLEKRFSKTN